MKNAAALKICGLLLSLCGWASHSWAQPAQPLQVGAFDLSQAQLHYSNPDSGVSLNAAQTRDLVRKLLQTQVLNQAEVDQQLKLQGNMHKGQGFTLANPYYPRYTGQNLALPELRHALVGGVEQSNPEGYAQTQEGYFITNQGRREYYGQEPVAAWFSEITHGGAAAQEVCALRFESDHRRYRLKTFPSVQAARSAGWTVTHQYHCGACSSLQDLAVYIGVTDLTTPVRLCSKRGYGRNANLASVKNCIEKAVGFSPVCAEAWAYNAMHTAQQCMSTCLQAYGGGHDATSEGLDVLAWAQGAYRMLVKEEFNACPPQVPSSNAADRQRLQQAGCPLSNEVTGKLNACLWCDERLSGPGFKYQAARTRRNSGLVSEIPRDHDKLFYAADHSQYFSAPVPNLDASSPAR